MAHIRFDAFTLAASVSELTSETEAPEADAIEFRMDLATDPLDQLEAYSGDLPIIVTNRAKWEGGDASDAGRLADLGRAVEHPTVGAVDIELESARAGDADELRDLADRHDTTVIVSTHDFDATPDRPQLSTMLEEAAKWGDLAKLAVTAQTVDDVLDVLTVTREQTRAGRAVATMCMGEVGRHSRIVAPLYGSKIGYAPIDANHATAPGQFPLAEMARLIETLRG